MIFNVEIAKSIVKKPNSAKLAPKCKRFYSLYP